MCVCVLACVHHGYKINTLLLYLQLNCIVPIIIDHDVCHNQPVSQSSNMAPFCIIMYMYVCVCVRVCVVCVCVLVCVCVRIHVIIMHEA